MEMESPENQTDAGERKPLEIPAEIAEHGESGSNLPGVSDRPSNAAREDLPKNVWTPETVPVEPSFVVVDPYTAAPPATFPATGIPLDDQHGEPGQDGAATDDPFIPLPYSPSPQSDTVRRSGLAWSAGIAFFGSVAFTLFLGWIADLLLGISPWGIVGGIVFGSIIGFLQFFRITSRIFPSRDDGPEITPLMSRKDDE